MSECGFLGTGGAVATPERDNTALVFNRNEDLVLIDCPGSAIAKIGGLGWDPRKIAALCITHTHPDHVYGLPAFVHGMLGTDRQVPIYGSSETIEFCVNLLDLFHLRKPEARYRILPFVVKPGDTFSPGGGLLCTALSVRHKPASLGFQFEWGKRRRRLVYSGDTAIHAPLFELARGADYLVHDCSAPARLFRNDAVLSRMHSSALELGARAQAADIQCLIPCHLFSHRGVSAAEIELEIRNSYKRELIVPRDLEIIRLRAGGRISGKGNHAAYSPDKT